MAQVQLRAARMGHSDAPVDLAASTSVADAIATFDQGDAPEVLVIDSIQTLYLDNLDSAPGTVGQVRGTSQGGDSPGQTAGDCPAAGWPCHQRGHDCGPQSGRTYG